jgi:hypothetical protein
VPLPSPLPSRPGLSALARSASRPLCPQSSCPCPDLYLHARASLPSHPLPHALSALSPCAPALTSAFAAGSLCPRTVASPLSALGLRAISNSALTPAFVPSLPSHPLCLRPFSTLTPCSCHLSLSLPSHPLLHSLSALSPRALSSSALTSVFAPSPLSSRPHLCFRALSAFVPSAFAPSQLSGHSRRLCPSRPPCPHFCLRALSAHTSAFAPSLPSHPLCLRPFSTRTPWHPSPSQPVHLLPCPFALRASGFDPPTAPFVSSLLSPPPCSLPLPVSIPIDRALRAIGASGGYLGVPLNRLLNHDGLTMSESYSLRSTPRTLLASLSMPSGLASALTSPSPSEQLVWLVNSVEAR